MLLIQCYKAVLLLLLSTTTLAQQNTFVDLLFQVSGISIEREGCGKKPWTHVKWRILSNGTVKKTRNHRDCLIFDGVDIDGTADRFEPLVLTINTNGEWEYILSHGSAYKEDNQLFVFGDGSYSDATVTFFMGDRTEQYLLPFVEEPRCYSKVNIDCQGYIQKGNSNFIYYGEDDLKVVIWELGILIHASHKQYGDSVPVGIMYEYPEVWDKWERRVEQYNKIYKDSGIFVRYKLKNIWLSHYHNLREVEQQALELPVDIVLAYGTSHPNTCGVAYPNVRFNYGQPPASMSRCNIATDLHEIGHSVGLAHGPENQAYQRKGYIFPQFGHGWNDVCGRYDDIMSYGRDRIFHTNSNKTCNDVLLLKENNMAGNRNYTDTAYAINRVRYDVSLIYNDVLEGKDLKPIKVQARRLRQLIID